MQKPEHSLPIDDVCADLVAALSDHGVCVLQAPPGAGKTTKVPLALLEAGAFTGKLLMLEPRRLAARAAAERMAHLLGEPVGQTIGYRMRGASKTSPGTRIEVVTEGILTRMIQSDPGLTGIGAVVFDEFHERSLNADLGLALVWEARGALRCDLQVLVMSATLDAAPVAELLDGAPVITSDGRAFPVETRWLPKPLRKEARLEASTAELIHQALDETEGGILVFLPGEGEIRRVITQLNLPDGAVALPLYGALPFAQQRAAIEPAKQGRKIVLATAIAETSLTIEDVRVVIDAGRARRARFDPGSGMSRLVTERVSMAEADQRRGRAGRVASGVCYRLWTKAEEGALPRFPPAEIEAADLAGLALDLAAWGATPGELAFLTHPPEGAYAQAQNLLRMLGALDAGNRITQRGKALAKIPLHPRLAHMLASSDAKGAQMAALLMERDPLGRGAGTDVGLRLRALQDGSGHKGATAQIKTEAKRLAKFANGPKRTTGEMAALAYPDRIGLRRPGDAPRYVLSGGKGAVMPPEDALAGQRLIVALGLDGDTREAKLRLTAALSEAELRGLYGDQITWQNSCAWVKRDRQVSARRQERFGALILADQLWRDAPPEAMATALTSGIRDLGLGCLTWSKPAKLLRARVLAAGRDMPDWSDENLLATLEGWLAPHLAGMRSAEDLKALDLHGALSAALPWDMSQRLNALAPAKYRTPMDRMVAVDYSGDQPEIAVRLQEMFGLTTHPMIGQQPLKLTLLSPGGKPVQVTTDLPGFWASSYTDVRKDMRGRYPRHPWPEDPTAAAPTLRAKPRGT